MHLLCVPDCKRTGVVCNVLMLPSFTRLASRQDFLVHWHDKKGTGEDTDRQHCSRNTRQEVIVSEKYSVQFTDSWKLR